MKRVSFAASGPAIIDVERRRARFLSQLRREKQGRTDGRKINCERHRALPGSTGLLPIAFQERLQILGIAVSRTWWGERLRLSRRRWRRDAFCDRPDVGAPWTRIGRDAKGARSRIDRVLGRVMQRHAGACDWQIGGGELDMRVSLLAPWLAAVQ